MALKSVAFDTVEDASTVFSSDALGDMVGFQIVGSWSGVFTFEATTPGQSSAVWVSIMATNVATNALATTTTANGIFRIVSDGLDVRCRFSTDTSGSGTIYPFQRVV